MLKRQRAETPPRSSSSSVPLITNDSDAPNAKRRRYQPPALDGATRGWMTTNVDDEDDGYDEEDEDTLESPSETVTGQSSGQAEDYTSANSFLHELHTLHQHRKNYRSPTKIPFSSPSPPSSPPFDESYTASKNHDPIHPSFTAQGGESCCTSGEESDYVRKHYEDSNRLLGSLILSRRRELHLEEKDITSRRS